MFTSIPVEFSITVIGTTTGNTYAGKFKAKPKLSHADQMRRDRVRREFLGPNGNEATSRAQSQAEVFSDLMVTLVETPEWWLATDNGTALFDDNVIKEILDNVERIRREAADEVQRGAEAAVPVIKKAIDSTPKV